MLGKYLSSPRAQEFFLSRRNITENADVRAIEKVLGIILRASNSRLSNAIILSDKNVAIKITTVDYVNMIIN